MTEQKLGSGLQGSLAGAREPTAERRSDLPDSPDLNGDAPNSDLHDISKILLGAQAISGKALTSAGRMTVSEEARHALRDQQTREDRQARELANLARWNTQMTTVGGVQMTNEQAQKARQNVIDNGDAYADWAVRKGLISEDQKDEFKTGVRRKKELEDKRGRGTLTTAEAAEEARLDQSRVGKAIDAATAQNHLDKNIAPAPSVEAARTAVSAASADNRGVGSDKPVDLSSAFAAKAPPGQAVAAQDVPPPARVVQASGLDI